MKTLTLLAVLGLLATASLSLTACKDNPSSPTVTPTTTPDEGASPGSTPADSTPADPKPAEDAGPAKDGESCGGKGDG